MTQHTTHFYCGQCGWTMPREDGPLPSHAARTLPLVGDHIDATGHAVRITITTHGALHPESLEVSTVLCQRRS